MRGGNSRQREEQACRAELGGNVVCVEDTERSDVAESNDCGVMEREHGEDRPRGLRAMDFILGGRGSYWQVEG